MEKLSINFLFMPLMTHNCKTSTKGEHAKCTHYKNEENKTFANSISKAFINKDINGYEEI